VLKILLIDDEKGTRKLLSISLRNEGYDVITADNGKSGLELFRQESPSIILTDLQMPGMDGIDVLRRIKQINPDTEVIVITGFGDMEKAVKSIQFEASDFITKPIKKDALSGALRRAEAKLKVKQALKHYTFNLEKAVKEKTQALEKSHKEMKAICDITYSLDGKKYLAEAFDLIIERIKDIFLFEEAVPHVRRQRIKKSLYLQVIQCIAQWILPG
jgi:YesN/AraC family two-component response regulator